MSDQRAIIAIINLKGGTTKTTSAVWLAHGLDEQGYAPLLVDADPQGSALGWNEDAPEPFPFPVVGLATKQLHRTLPDFIRPEVKAVVIDTPPFEEQAGIVMSALRLATVVIVPVGATPIEYKRFRRVVEIVNSVADIRADNEAPPLVGLMNRVRPEVQSRYVWREQIMKDGIDLFKADIMVQERFSQSYGENPRKVSQTAYGDVVTELRARGLV